MLAELYFLSNYEGFIISISINPNHACNTYFSWFDNKILESLRITVVFVWRRWGTERPFSLARRAGEEPSYLFSHLDVVHSSSQICHRRPLHRSPAYLKKLPPLALCTVAIALASVVSGRSSLGEVWDYCWTETKPKTRTTENPSLFPHGSSLCEFFLWPPGNIAYLPFIWHDLFN